jgi:pentatricopeptide repeat protein
MNISKSLSLLRPPAASARLSSLPKQNKVLSPIPFGGITANFGQASLQTRSFHNSPRVLLDQAAPTGTPIPSSETAPPPEVSTTPPVWSEEDWKKEVQSKAYDYSWELYNKEVKKGFQPTKAQMKVVMEQLSKFRYFKCMKEIYERDVRKFGWIPDLDMHNLLLHGMAEWTIGYPIWGRTMEMLAWLEGPMKNDGIKPDLTTFETCITCMSEVAQFEQCWEMYTKMEEYGIKPTEKIYVAVLQCIRKLKSMDANTKQLTDRMTAEGLAIPEPPPPPPPKGIPIKPKKGRRR